MDIKQSITVNLTSEDISNAVILYMKDKGIKVEDDVELCIKYNTKDLFDILDKSPTKKVKVKTESVIQEKPLENTPVAENMDYLKSINNNSPLFGN